jgi:ssDNA-specific exonuclease RecJ
MLKKSLFGLFKGEMKSNVVGATNNSVIVDAVEVTDVPVISKMPTDYQIQEVLTFYMEQSRNLSEQLANANKKNISLENQISDLSKLLGEKDIENTALKTANTSMKKKITTLEKKVTRLTAIEKVWKETISKLNIVSGSLEPAPAGVTANGDGANDAFYSTALGPAYFGAGSGSEEYLVEE